jgi:hypothetical protein
MSVVGGPSSGAGSADDLLVVFNYIRKPWPFTKKTFQTLSGVVQLFSTGAPTGVIASSHGECSFLMAMRCFCNLQILGTVWYDRGFG